MLARQRHTGSSAGRADVMVVAGRVSNRALLRRVVFEVLLAMAQKRRVEVFLLIRPVQVSRIAKPWGTYSLLISRCTRFSSFSLCQSVRMLRRISRSMA